MKRLIILLKVAMVLSVLLAACVTPTPEVITKEVVVKETIIVAAPPHVVEKEVIQIVEVEKVVTATKPPQPGLMSEQLKVGTVFLMPMSQSSGDARETIVNNAGSSSDFDVLQEEMKKEGWNWQSVEVWEGTFDSSKLFVLIETYTSRTYDVAELFYFYSPPAGGERAVGAITKSDSAGSLTDQTFMKVVEGQLVLLPVGCPKWYEKSCWNDKYCTDYVTSTIDWSKQDCQNAGYLYHGYWLATWPFTCDDP